MTFTQVNVINFTINLYNKLYTGNETPYSYVPMAFLNIPEQMSFSQRFSNMIYSTIEKVGFNFYNLPKHRKVYRKYFPKAKKTFDDVHQSLSILFMSSHVSMSSARPLLPNMIEIGGIHIQPAKPLPKDIKSFLDSASAGAVLFSMGSFVQSKDWTQSQREAFLKAFAKLKIKVLWKYENETLPGKPDNVMIGSWIPQRDVVAHPNVKLFITHGGNLGMTEAVYEAVPLLGIPLFGDQMMNMRRAVAKGYALTLDYRNITESNVYEAINELLKNPKFEENSKKISKIFKDRPLGPIESVVFWTELVIRQQGADYLKASGRTLNFFEFHLIDVYATLFAGLFVFIMIDWFVIKLFFKTFKKSSANKQKKQ